MPYYYQDKYARAYALQQTSNDLILKLVKQSEKVVEQNDEILKNQNKMINYTSKLIELLGGNLADQPCIVEIE